MACFPTGAGIVAFERQLFHRRGRYPPKRMDGRGPFRPCTSSLCVAGYRDSGGDLRQRPAGFPEPFQLGFSTGSSESFTGGHHIAGGSAGAGRDSGDYGGPLLPGLDALVVCGVAVMRGSVLSGVSVINLKKFTVIFFAGRRTIEKQTQDRFFPKTIYENEECILLCLTRMLFLRPAKL